MVRQATTSSKRKKNFLIASYPHVRNLIRAFAKECETNETVVSPF